MLQNPGVQELLLNPVYLKVEHVFAIRGRILAWYGKSILHLLMRFETRKLENEEMIISYAEQQLQFYYYNSSVGIGELVHSTRFLLDYVAFAFQKSPFKGERKRERMKVKLCIGFPNLE